MIAALAILHGLLAAGLATGDDEAAALERYKVASQAKEQALLSLEMAYGRGERAWTEWRQAETGRTPPLAGFLAARCADYERAAAERRSAAPAGEPPTAKEARNARRADLEELTNALRGALTARGLDEPSLRETLAAAVAHAAIASRGGREDGADAKGPKELESRLATLLAPWLGESQRFELLWNEVILPASDEVRDWRERYDEYIAAGVELDRVRHPESYLPGGAKTRAGMVYVAGGTYTVGPNSGFERKKKKVTVRPFLADRCEVSNAEYVTFLESLTPEQRIVRTPRQWEIGGDGRAQPPADKLDHPVVGVSWRDADAYARFVGKRVPSEDEWEIAARGREAFVYPWGNDYVEGRCNDVKQKRGATTPVADFEAGASPFKVLNLSGNVEEWTSSLEDGDVFTDLPSNIAAVIVRGGYYQSAPQDVSALFRWVAPGGSSHEIYIGFRCVADLK